MWQCREIPRPYRLIHVRKTRPRTTNILTANGNRRWHLIRLEGQEDFDETWIPDHPCYGHNPDDTTPLHGLFLEASSS